MTQTNTLRTLKDLEIENQKFYIKSQDGENMEWEKCSPHCYSDDIRAEAIKWIKELEKCHRPEDYDFPKEYGDFVSSDEFGSSAGNVIEWIKHFCNITEEELK